MDLEIAQEVYITVRKDSLGACKLVNFSSLLSFSQNFIFHVNRTITLRPVSKVLKFLEELPKWLG